MNKDVILHSLSKKYDFPPDKFSALDYESANAFYATVKAIEINPQFTEVPIFTIVNTVYINGINLTDTQIQDGIYHLIEVGLLSLRIGDYGGTEMISLSSVIKPI